MYYLENGLQLSDDGALVHVMGDNMLKQKEEIWLWNIWLGHPSFGYLRRLFPSLFTGCNLSDFVCDTCVMAKSHRSVFYSHDNCHAPNPSPTRLADPNRFPGRETKYWDSLLDLFLFFLKPNWYLWVWPTSYNIIKIPNIYPNQKKYHWSGVHQNLHEFI